MSTQLHMFSDASKEGYGTVGYIRIVTPDGKVRLVFVGGKSHVVPLDSSRTSHHNSIPRLELVSALKSVILMKTIQRSLPVPIEDVVFWTDAICVWRQILDETGTPKAFVANRVSKIRKNTKNNKNTLCLPHAILRGLNQCLCLPKTELNAKNVT